MSRISPASGKTAGGTLITVVGANFTRVRAVRFGSVNGTSVHVLSSSRLQVKAPAHRAGTVDVRVVTAAGTSAVGAQDHYTYIAPPTVARIGPHAGTTAGGTRVTVIGTNFVHVSRVSFGGAFGKSIKVLSSTKLLVTAPAHRAATADVRVTTAYGSSAVTSADRFTYVIPMAGTVTADADGTPLAGVTVLAIDTHSFAFTTAVTRANGTFALPSLVGGSYYVCYDPVGVTTGPSTTGYVPECFDNVDINTQPPPVTVVSGHTTTVNAGLASGGEISGTISTSDSAAIQDVDVMVFDSAGNQVADTLATSGAYHLMGVPVGSYTVCFDATGVTGGAAHGYQSQCWNNITWGGGFANIPAGTTPVSSTAGTNVTGIDAVLAAKP